MLFECVTCIRNKGDSKKTGRPYDMLAVGGIITTPRGTEMCEITLDGDQPVPERGKKYELEVQFYPDREKRLAFKVVGLRAAGLVAKAA